MVIGKFKDSKEYQTVCKILTKKYPDKQAYFWPWPMVGEDGYIVVKKHTMWVDKINNDEVIEALKFIHSNDKVAEW